MVLGSWIACHVLGFAGGHGTTQPYDAWHVAEHVAHTHSIISNTRRPQLIFAANASCACRESMVKENYGDEVHEHVYLTQG